MKIYTACSTGLGSSFMTQLNIEKALGELGVEGVETDHTGYRIRDRKHLRCALRGA